MPSPNRKAHIAPTTSKPYMKIQTWLTPLARAVVYSSFIRNATICRHWCRLLPPWPLLLILTSQYMLELVHIHIEGISGYDNTEILFFRLVKWVFMCDYTILLLPLLLLLLVFRYSMIFLFSLSLSLSPRVFFSLGRLQGWMCMSIVPINTSH